MTANNSKSKGCFGSVGVMITGFVGLLGAIASCISILQYIEGPSSASSAGANSPSVVVITSEPASNNQPSSNQPSSNQPSSNQTSSNQTTLSISAEDRQAVEDFLRQAVVAEITAYQYGDASYASMFYGDALQSIDNEIQDLNSKGLYLDAHFDYDNSYVHDIRVPESNRIEVDSCEYWAQDYYDRQTGSLLSSNSWALVPQTIVIEYLNSDFYITSVAFYTGQAFCS